MTRIDRFTLTYSQMLTIAQHAIEERERGATVADACLTACREFEPCREVAS